MKKLEWLQHYSLILKRSRAANSEGSDGILSLFKLIQAFIVGLVSCKDEVDPSKNEGTRVVTTFLPLYVYGDFFRRSRAAYSTVPGRILPKGEFQICPSMDFEKICMLNTYVITTTKMKLFYSSKAVWPQGAPCTNMWPIKYQSQIINIIDCYILWMEYVRRLPRLYLTTINVYEYI